MVIELDGWIWIIREFVICYFYVRQWFNVIGMLREDGVYYYCNISFLFVYDGEVIKYIDYDLDVKVFFDMIYNIFDEDEYDDYWKVMNYLKEIDSILRDYLNMLFYWIYQCQGLFVFEFVDMWYEWYLCYIK